MFYTEPQTLVVVCKDEMLVNHLRKLVETKDDTGENSVVGTRDGSVKIVAWTEKSGWIKRRPEISAQRCFSLVISRVWIS